MEKLEMTHVCESSFGTKVHVGNCSERYPSFEEQFIKINEQAQPNH